MAAHSLLTPAQAAERLGLSVKELTELIAAGEGPQHIEIRSVVRFLARDLDEWAEALTNTHDERQAEPGDED